MALEQQTLLNFMGCKKDYFAMSCGETEYVLIKLQPPSAWLGLAAIQA